MRTTTVAAVSRMGQVSCRTLARYDKANPAIPITTTQTRSALRRLDTSVNARFGAEGDGEPGGPAQPLGGVLGLPSVRVHAPASGP